MKTLWLIFAVLVFAGVSAAQSGSISGTVTFGDDNSVMHDVSIQIVELRRTTVTDAAGKYQFNDIPAGKYTVTAHQEGFGDMRQTVVVKEGDAVTADFRLVLAGIQAQVTVTAGGAEETAFESIASVSSIGSNEITARAAAGLGDVLDNEAGVSKRSNGPGASRPVIRGFDGDRVKVASDGISVGSLASQSGDHSEPVDTLSLERIEVVKGPATLLYGSNAIGGVINAISGHDEGSHPGIRGYFSTIGSTNSNQAAVSGGLEYGFRRWMFWGNGSGQRTGAYKAGNDFGEVRNTFTRNASGTGGFGYYGDRAHFNTSYTFFQSRYGIPLDFREIDPEERQLRVWRNNVKLNFGYNDQNLFVSGIKLTADISNYRHQEIADDAVGTTFRNRVYSLRGLFDQKKYGKLGGRFGFEGFQRFYSTMGDETLIDGPVKQNSFSVFGLEELEFERVLLQIGGRIENNRYKPVNPVLRERSFTGFSGAVGARFGLWKGGAFVANFTHGSRAPALDELYNNGPHDGTLAFEIGNPELKLESSNGIDLSLRHQNERFKAEANFFYYGFQDFVFLAPTGMIDKSSGFSINEYRQENSRFTGTELSLDITANRYLNILTGLDYVNAQLSDGRPLPRIAPLRGRFALDVHYRNLSVKPEFTAVGDQDRVFENESPTAGYGVFNVSGTFIIPSKHYASIFTVNAFNLGNRLYYNHVSFIKDISPEVGRGLRFGYTIRFF